MKKLYFKLKYSWHVLQFNQLNEIINDCLDESTRIDLKNKIHYHEKSALHCIMKC